MNSDRKHLGGAFLAMLFVGVTWGVNLPVTKVMLQYFDIFPLSTLRLITSCTILAIVLVALEGKRALRIDIGFMRFAQLGLMMSSFFAIYALGIQFSDPIAAAAFQVGGPLVSAVTVRLVTGLRFDPGFGVALALTLLGGAILGAPRFIGSGPVGFRGGEVVVLLSNALWTLYSIKAQAWFSRASQLHRTYVSSLSALGWTLFVASVMVATGLARSPFGVQEPWVWSQLIFVAILASGLGGLFWNIGASRLGVAVASLWVNLVPFFAILWSMAYGFSPNIYQIVGGLVALTGVVYMQWRKLSATAP
jgi:drug/metabolite transporter (DMT)-like permease